MYMTYFLPVWYFWFYNQKHENRQQVICGQGSGVFYMENKQEKVIHNYIVIGNENI